MSEPKKKPRPICSCGARKNDAGLCPFGCDPFRAPHASLKKAEADAKEREKRARQETIIGLSPKQARDGAIANGVPKLERGFGFHKRVPR